MNSELSLTRAGAQYKLSSCDPCLHFFYREDGGTFGAFAAHIDATLGRWEPDALSETQTSLEARMGKLEIQESPSVHVRMEVSQAIDYSSRLTQADYSSKVVPRETPPAL